MKNKKSIGLNHLNSVKKFSSIKCLLFIFTIIITKCKSLTHEDVNHSSYSAIITELNSSNLSEFMEKSENILILFIEPNCLKCNRFIKIILELNDKLVNYNNELKNIKLATVDGFHEKSVVENFEIEEFPTFLYLNKKFDNSEKVTDLQSSKDLLLLLEKKMVRKWNLLDDVNKLVSFEEKNINLIICRNEKNYIHQDIFDKINQIVKRFEDVKLFFVDKQYYKELYKNKNKSNLYLKTGKAKRNKTSSNETRTKINNNNLISEKNQNLLKYLNCTDDTRFNLHIYKNFDEDHLFIENLQFNYEEKLLEDWIFNSVTHSVQTLTSKDIANIYYEQKPSLIYIEKPYSKKISNSEIENAIESNELYNLFYQNSLKHKKILSFFKTKETDISTQLIFNLAKFQGEELPAIIGIKSNKEEKNIYRKILTHHMDLNQTKKILNIMIKQFIKNDTLNYDYINYKENKEELNNEDSDKFEIYRINSKNFKKYLLERDNTTTFILFTFKNKINPDILDFMQRLLNFISRNKMTSIKLGVLDLIEFPFTSKKNYLIIYPNFESNSVFLSNSDYLIYDNFWSIQKIINFLSYNKINLNQKDVNLFEFTDEEKEILRIKNSLALEKLVIENEQNKPYIFNVFKNEIESHNYYVKEQFMNNNHKNNNIKEIKENVDKNQNKIGIENLQDDIVESNDSEIKKDDDLKFKSDF